MTLRSKLRAQDQQGTDRWPRVGFTGHRDLEPEDREWLSCELVRVLTKLRTENGSGVLVNGMAIGSDLMAAAAGLDAGLALWAYMPFPDQSARWSSADVLEQERLRVQAQRTVVLGDGPAAAGPRNRYLRLLHDRNRLIVRDADVLLAVHDRRRTSGGSFVTIGHARAAGLAVVKVDPHRRDTRISR